MHRTRLAVGQLLLTVLVGFFAGAAYSGFADVLPPTARVVAGVLEVVGSCVALVWGWRSTRKQIREKLLNAPTPEQSWRNMRASRSRAAGQAAGGRWIVLLAPLLVPLVAYLLGMVCASAFIRELPSEVGARRALGQEA
ncbi:hypothetical protein AB0I49_36340 [Streptomyces sp. NPDC050617]|uniref:hypothetical protein n=1 Tax=Streptomyces sp. NPDC050617 TaxID=3154628 RepID=UPI00343BA1C0